MAQTLYRDHTKQVMPPFEVSPKSGVDAGKRSAHIEDRSSVKATTDGSPIGSTRIEDFKNCNSRMAIEYISHMQKALTTRIVAVRQIVLQVHVSKQGGNFAISPGSFRERRSVEESKTIRIGDRDEPKKEWKNRVVVSRCWSVVRRHGIVGRSNSTC